MNKDFEIEYKEYSKLNTPDLWSRIEEGIDKIDESSNVVSIDKPVKKKKNYGRYIGIIAAAACVLIAVPYLLFNSKSSNMSAASDTASAAAEAPMMAATSEAAAPMMAEEPMMEEVSEAPMMAEEPMMDTECEAAPAMEAEESEAAKEDKSMNGTALKAVAENAEGKSAVTVYFAEDYRDDGNIDYVTLDDGDYSVKVVFEANEDIKNFTFMQITITGVEEDGTLKVEKSDCFTKKTFKNGDAVGITLTFPGDLPNYAISYDDEKGNTRTFTLSESGYDGSLVLAEEKLAE